MAQISSIARGPRESSFELLRILAMLMVLMLHINFATEKFIWPVAFDSSPASAWTRAILEYTAIPAVDIFVMISGWFRIRPNKKGLASFLFQLMYFVIISAILSFIITGNSTHLLPSNLWTALWAPWFVPTYLLLYLMSPILNAFLGRVTPEKSLLTTLILYATAWIMSLTTGTDIFNGGYNLLTFIILYLLAASLRGLKENLNESVSQRQTVDPNDSNIENRSNERTANSSKSLRIFFRRIPLILLFLAATSINLIAFRAFHKPWVWSYANPLIILQSATFLLLTATAKSGGRHLKLKRIINSVAASAFSVYLLHMNPGIFGPCFKTWGKQLWSSFSGPALIATLFGYILLWYCAAVILDQPRRRLDSFLRHQI